MTYPDSFQRQIHEILGEKSEAFFAAMSEKPPVSIRLNSKKVVSKEYFPETKSEIPWHSEGRYLPARPVFTLDPLLHAGAYYVQEASSMFLKHILTNAVDFSKSLKIIDLCAAPGGKSTLVADLISEDSLLVCNEIIRSRLNVLKENLEKWGSRNTAITSAAPEDLQNLKGFFDVVVTDAPCSGEGLFRRDADAVKEWSPEHVEFCAARQKNILAAAVEMLASEGILVFSTCTWNETENEENVKWLLKNFDLQVVSVDVPAGWGVVSNEFGHRFYPHKLGGEGFFIAVLKKGGNGEKTPALKKIEFTHLKPVAKNVLPILANFVRNAERFSFYETPNGDIRALQNSLLPNYVNLDKVLKIKWFGTEIGALKGKELVPAPALALSNIWNKNLQSVNLTRTEALLFLKKETFATPENWENLKGWTLMKYADLPLGWAKLMSGRWNNYYPQEWRIRMGI